MLEILESSRSSRRTFLGWSVLSSGLPMLWGSRGMAGAVPTGSEAARAGIFVFLTGGPSHIDMWDLKPNAPAEFRGPFQPISTAVPGLQICEHLPRLAKCADKYVLLRNVSHNFGAHDLGQIYICTGTRPVVSLRYPDYGAVVASKSVEATEMPSYIGVPDGPRGAGFLGPAFNAFATGNLPGQNRPIPLRGLQLPRGISVDELDQRHRLLTTLDRQFDAVEQEHELTQALDRFNNHAHQVIRSSKMREAFDLSKEPPSFVEQFGKDPFGQACLLSIRLVEAGVKFVAITLSGWDTHANNFPTLEQRLLPTLDVGLAGLLNGLTSRGLLPSTAVLVAGEFGRTPKINSAAGGPGRDHHPRCMSVLMAGGRIEGGQCIGSSDDRAIEPDGTAYSPDDVAATFYANMGIDPKLQFQTGGRPITLVRDGNVIDALLS